MILTPRPAFVAMSDVEDNLEDDEEDDLDGFLV
jgi:hypothetical protein